MEENNIIQVRILVTASREWPSDLIWVMRDEILRACRDILFIKTESYSISYIPKIIVVHGDARGGDHYCKTYAMQQGWQDEAYPVKSEEYRLKGKKAYWDRNKYMVSLGADVCLAFIWNDSRGSSGTADLAETAGIVTRRFHGADPVAGA